jgi:hypothetical protein
MITFLPLPVGQKNTSIIAPLLEKGCLKSSRRHSASALAARGSQEN